MVEKVVALPANTKTSFGLGIMCKTLAPGKKGIQISELWRDTEDIYEIIFPSFHLHCPAVFTVYHSSCSYLSHITFFITQDIHWAPFCLRGHTVNSCEYFMNACLKKRWHTVVWLCHVDFLHLKCNLTSQACQRCAFVSIWRTWWLLETVLLWIFNKHQVPCRSEPAWSRRAGFRVRFHVW